MAVRNLRLTIAYDGSYYSGWQIQPNAVTIQALLQNAVRDMTGEETNVIGAGRTDAGVHALAQVASFKTEKNISLEGFRCGLNSKLPRDIRINKIEESAENFHPMRDAKGKHYRYLFSEEMAEHPLYLNRRWCVGRKLNIDAMKKAAKFLIGKHDFTSFRAADGCDDNAIREVRSVKISSVSSCSDEYDVTLPFFSLDITGGGFLKNMVRNIVGTLVDVGLGKISPDQMNEILAAKDRKKAGVCAPACGLYLVSVSY